MREFDDNPHSYGPVLRRIAILAAVIVMVPVMLWIITSFMRTYVAQPVIASAKPLLAPTTTASINTSTVTPSWQSPAPAVEARPTTNESNAASSTGKVASLATSDMPPSSVSDPATQPAASSPWPDPTQAIGGQTAGAQMSAPDTTAATTTNDDALPPSPPLAGPIPLPPRRPAVIAMSATGAIPLPRARPSDAGTPAQSTTEGGSNFLTHLFGQTH